MSQRRPRRAAESAAAPATLDGPTIVAPAWSRGRKRLISAWLLFHIVAVIAAPMAVAPASRLAGNAWALCQPYLDLLFLNHGYRFFAPEPGPSHLVRYQITQQDGTILEGEFPDRNVHKPRLLYHRHFMLAERLAAGEPGTPWIDAYARSYARHLYLRHNASEVRLWQRRHLIPSALDVLSGMKLTDPRLYIERDLVIYRGETP